MDTWRRLRLYVRAVELGSLSAAARDLGVSQPTASKAVAAIERELQVRLIERSTTRLSPTDAGQRFAAVARRLLEDYAEAVADARGDAAAPTGLLRINAPYGFGQLHLDAIVQRFLDRHPGVEVELVLDDRYVDLVEAGVDVALRWGGPLPPAAVARPLASARRWLVAAPGHPAAHPPLLHPRDLAGHAFVRFAWLAGGSRATLHGPDGRQASVELQGRYSTNSGPAIRSALLAGRGIGFAPRWLVQDLVDEGRLVRVLDGWAGEPQTLHAVWPSRHWLPARTRLFVDALREALAAVPGLEPPPR